MLQQHIAVISFLKPGRALLYSLLHLYRNVSVYDLKKGSKMERKENEDQSTDDAFAGYTIISCSNNMSKRSLAALVYIIPSELPLSSQICPPVELCRLNTLCSATIQFMQTKMA